MSESENKATTEKFSVVQNKKEIIVKVIVNLIN